jgi:hypothetical protein
MKYNAAYFVGKLEMNPHPEGEQYPNYYLTDNIYISPKIGIVYRKTNEINFGPTIKQTWTLINYHLNQ